MCGASTFFFGAQEMACFICAVDVTGAVFFDACGVFIIGVVCCGCICCDVGYSVFCVIGDVLFIEESLACIMHCDGEKAVRGIVGVGGLVVFRIEDICFSFSVEEAEFLGGCEGFDSSESKVVFVCDGDVVGADAIPAKAVKVDEVLFFGCKSSFLEGAGRRYVGEFFDGFVVLRNLG